MSTPFGAHIRRLRLAARLSLRDVAKATGMSHVYIGEVERGRRGPFIRERWPLLTGAIPGLTLEDLQRLAVEEAFASDRDEDGTLLAEIRRLRGQLRLTHGEAEMAERGRVVAWFRDQSARGGWIGLGRRDLAKEFHDLGIAIDSGVHLPGWPGTK